MRIIHASKLVILLLTAMASNTMAQDSYTSRGKEVTKVQAMRALILDERAQVFKCTPQILTPKGTMKNKGKK